MLAQATAGDGDVSGLIASTASPQGAAAILEVPESADLIRGIGNGAEVFLVNAEGDVTAGRFDGDGSGLTNLPDLWVDETGDTLTGTLTLDPTSGFALITGAGDHVDLGGELYRNGAPFLHAGGIDNTALGSGALSSNTGSDNTALGDDALRNNTSGYGNTATGSGALRNNTNGHGNTAHGDYALFFNTSGLYGTAVGHWALRGNTTAIGNTAVGESAMVANTTGETNTAVGWGALRNNTTGFGNVALGAGAGANTVGSNNIVIGNAGVAESNRIRIGTPGSHTATFIAGIRSITTGQANAVPVLIDSNGQLGTINSSRRFKEDIRELGETSQRLFELRPVAFRYRRAVQAGERPVEYGLIAEEVAEVFPELVVRDELGRPETVRYHALVPLLLNELQRQQREIEAQESRHEEQRRVLERHIDGAH